MGDYTYGRKLMRELHSAIFTDSGGSTLRKGYKWMPFDGKIQLRSANRNISRVVWSDEKNRIVLFEGVNHKWYYVNKSEYASTGYEICWTLDKSFKCSNGYNAMVPVLHAVPLVIV